MLSEKSDGIGLLFLVIIGGVFICFINMHSGKVAITLKLRNMNTESNIKPAVKEESIRGLSKGFLIALAINIVPMAAIVRYMNY